MVHAKKWAVTALAALMIAGAIPAFASADTDVSSDTSTAQEEVVTETAKKPHKKRVKPSSDTGDSTDATRPSRRKAPKNSDATTNSDGTEIPDAVSGATQKPDASDSTDEGQIVQKKRPSRRPARKPAKKSESAATDTGTETATAETNTAETAV